MVMVSSVVPRLVECVLQVEVAADGVAVASMRVHTHAHIHADVHLRVHICEHACMFTCASVCACAFTCTRARTCKRTCAYSCGCACACSCTCTCAFVYMCMYMYLCTCPYTCTSTCMCTLTLLVLCVLQDVVATGYASGGVVVALVRAGFVCERERMRESACVRVCVFCVSVRVFVLCACLSAIMCGKI
jgi:hypothetical protein